VPNTAANHLLPLRLNKLTLVGNPPTNGAPATATALLTRRLAAGEEDAFREFHRLYFDRLYHFLLAVTRGQEQEAQEALQETFLRLLRHPRVFAEEDVFWCWLKAVARNAARDGHRKHRRYFALLQNFAVRPDCDPRESAGGGDSRLGALLEESLDELEPADRLLLENKYLAGETVRELSTTAGLSEKAVESRLLRLRRHLRARILEKLRTP
jgi:RNA polymerase sigma-70 factor (ECF subfamily)